MKALIFVVMLVIVAIETVLGVFRGIRNTALRVGIWLLGIIAAVLLTNMLTADIAEALLNGSGTEATGLAAVAAGMISSAVGGDLGIVLGNALGVSTSALALSLIRPFVFVIAYLILKLFGWLIEIVIRIILNKSRFKDTFDYLNNPWWSKLTGGILGFWVGMVTFAFIMSPVLFLARDVAESDAVAKITGTVRIVADDSRDVVKAVDKVGEICTKLAKNPAVYVSRYTGAEAASALVYSITAIVNPDEVSGGADTACYPDVISARGILERFFRVAEDINKVVVYVDEESGFTRELVETAEKVTVRILDTDLVDETSKLELLKYGLENGQKAINAVFGFPGTTYFLGEYDDYNIFIGDTDRLFKAARELAAMDWDYCLSSTNSEMFVRRMLSREMLNSDSAERAFEHLLKMTNGREMFSGFLNAVIISLLKENIPDVFDAAQMSGTDSYELVRALQAVSGLSLYLGRTSLEESEQYEVWNLAEQLRKFDFINSSAVDEARRLLFGE